MALQSDELGPRPVEAVMAEADIRAASHPRPGLDLRPSFDTSTERPGRRAVLVWGTQLSREHHSALNEYPDAPVIMIESEATCRKYRYHQQKIVLVLSAMRHYAAELRAAGRRVWYKPLDDDWDFGDDASVSSREIESGLTDAPPAVSSLTGYAADLAHIARTAGLERLAMMDTADIAPRRLTQRWCRALGIRFEVTPNTLFLTRGTDFANWVEGRGRLLMEDFYRWQRTRLKVLVDERGQPEGGRWNFDADNRKPLPRGLEVPARRQAESDEVTAKVIKLVSERFDDHPGDANGFWLPVTRADGHAWLAAFTHERLAHFGDYEDAMRSGEATIYHSVMTPLLNLGLIHPTELVAAVTGAYHDGAAPLAAVEGYIRQVIGWREFMHAMYHYKGETWSRSNWFAFKKELPGWWYTGGYTGDPAVSEVVERAIKYGYLHHIERLMVAGNFMLLSEYSPQAVYRWFMELFVDAYEWVMVPNVIGMSQFADGGTFATKPYVASGAYLQKMGKWYSSDAVAKASEFTTLYWQWLERQRPRLGSNQRMSMMYRLLDARGTSHDTAVKRS